MQHDEFTKIMKEKSDSLFALLDEIKTAYNNQDATLSEYGSDHDKTEKFVFSMDSYPKALIHENIQFEITIKGIKKTTDFTDCLK